MSETVGSPRLMAAGAKWWRTKIGASPSLSRGSLGDFFFEVLSAGGQVGTVWPFAPSYKRSAVFVTVLLTDAMKADLQERTRYRFEEPERPHV